MLDTAVAKLGGEFAGLAAGDADAACAWACAWACCIWLTVMRVLDTALARGSCAAVVIEGPRLRLDTALARGSFATLMLGARDGPRLRFCAWVLEMALARGSSPNPRCGGRCAMPTAARKGSATASRKGSRLGSNSGAVFEKPSGGNRMPGGDALFCCGGGASEKPRPVFN